VIIGALREDLDQSFTPQINACPVPAVVDKVAALVRILLQVEEPFASLFRMPDELLAAIGDKLPARCVFAVDEFPLRIGCSLQDGKRSATFRPPLLGDARRPLRLRSATVEGGNQCLLSKMLGESLRT